MSQPLVSICIPVRNRPALLAEAIRSAQDQTVQDIEIVVCDNQSDDETVDVARGLAKDDDRVKVYVNEVNLNAFNYGRVLQRAQGTYIKYLNSDDLLAPTAVERLVSAIETPGASLAFCRQKFIDMSGNEVATPHKDGLLKVSGDTVLPGRAFGNRILTQMCNLVGYPTAALFRRCGEDPTRPMFFAGRTWQYWVDTTQWLQLLEEGDAVYVDEPLALIRSHGGQEGRRRLNDLVYAFDIEGVTTSAIEGEDYLADRAEAMRSRTVVLRVFTHRRYIVGAEVGAVGGLDQLEGVRLATENLLAPPRADHERHHRSTGDTVFVLQDGPGATTAAAIERWRSTFAGRDDVSLVVTVDADERRDELAALLATGSGPAVEVRRVDAALQFDGPVMLITAATTGGELLAAAPPPRWGVPPWSCIASADQPPVWFR